MDCQQRAGLRVEIAEPGPFDDTSDQVFEEASRLVDVVPAHRHLAPIQEVGVTSGGCRYLVTAALPGGNAAERIRGGPLPVGEAVVVAAKLAAAFCDLHRASIVHGGVCPASVAWDAEGEPVLTGYIWLGQPVLADDVAHLAPEAIERCCLTAATDVYGLAMTLFTLVTGTPAHLAAARRGVGDLYLAALEGGPTAWPSEMTDSLTAILRAAVVPDPVERPSMETLGNALEAARSAEASRPAEASAAAVIAEAPAWGESPARGESLARVESPARGEAPAWVDAAEEAEAPAPVGATSVGGSSLLSPLDDGDTDIGSPSIAATARHSRLRAMALLVAMLVAAGTWMATRPSPTLKAPTPAMVHRRADAPPVPAVAKLDEALYQPTEVRATSEHNVIVLGWRLPAGAQRDGAGVVVRQDPAKGPGVTVLSRKAGVLATSWVVVGVTPGQQTCFEVGVVVERPTAGMALADAPPVCAQVG